MIFAGIIIGEAAHPGPRLRRRGPRSADARLARRSRRGSASDTVESTLESCENGLQMLHLNMRSYLSHIAETTALLRSIDQKPFIVPMNETFLNKGPAEPFLLATMEMLNIVTHAFCLVSFASITDALAPES